MNNYSTLNTERYFVSVPYCYIFQVKHIPFCVALTLPCLVWGRCNLSCRENYMYELKLPGFYQNKGKTSELITIGGRTDFCRLLQEVHLRKNSKSSTDI